MADTLGVEVKVCDSVHSALTDVDMIATCTDSRVPVYTSDMLKLHRPGAFLVRCRYDEMDDATFETVDRIFVNAQEGTRTWSSAQRRTGRDGRSTRPIAADMRRPTIPSSPM